MEHPGYGLVKTTLLDFPGLVAAVVFTAGCNLRCPWCQNPGLVRAPWNEGLWSPEAVLDFLESRRSVLQGVVVTGGEPLFQPRLVDFLGRVKALGFQIKLDTNGTYPRRLAALDEGLVDYVAFDVKNAPSVYARSVGASVRPRALADTLEHLKTRYPGRCEVRLTWVPGLNDVADLAEYAAFVGPGVPVWVQSYRPGPVLDPSFADARGPTPAEIAEVVAGLVAHGVDARSR